MARQSVYELVFRHTTRIERLLGERGGDGNGLIRKAERVRYRLSASVWRDLEYVSAERNRIGHQEHAYLEDRAEFERCAKRVIAAIEAIPFDHDSNLMGFFRRAFSNSGRRRRSQAPVVVQIAVAIVVGIVMLIMISNHHESRRKFDEAFDARRREINEHFNPTPSPFGTGGSSASATAAPAQSASTKKRKTQASPAKKQPASPTTVGPHEQETSPRAANPEPTKREDMPAADATPAPTGTIKMTSQELDSF